MRMIKYEGRSTVDELLKDPFLQWDLDDKSTNLALGIFGNHKI